jgi:hypothetical protein
MPRDSAITFRDIAGKLAVLRITCDKCGRSGQFGGNCSAALKEMDR